MTAHNAQHKRKRLHETSSTLIFVVAIIFLASTLRSPITGVGPIISSIREGLGISNVLAGFLTTIPLLAFAIVSPFAPGIARRIGIEKTLFSSIILLTIGIVIRALGTTFLLIFGTILIGVAISFGNVLVTSFFKLKYPMRIGLLTGIYTVSMNFSAAISVGISNPIAENTFWGWQGALSVSAILTVIAIFVWLPLLRGEKLDLAMLAGSSIDAPQIRIWKKPLAWAIAISMGFQSLLFYCSVSWVPEILVAQGYDADQAGLLSSLMQMAQIPMTFLVPIIAEKLHSQRPLVFIFTSLYLIGFTGLFLEQSELAVLWMILIGLAGGASFGTMMMLFTLRTNTAFEAAQISGFAQSIGYLLAAAGPVLFGWLHDATGSWDAPNILFIAAALILFIFSFISAKNRYL